MGPRGHAGAALDVPGVVAEQDVGVVGGPFHVRVNLKAAPRGAEPVGDVGQLEVGGV
jgi:hypothetical protein